MHKVGASFHLCDDLYLVETGHIGSSTGTEGNPSSTASLSSSVPVALATTTVGITQTSSAPSSTSPITSNPTSSPAVSDSALDPSTTANGSDASQASSSASSASANSSSGPSVKLIAGVTVLSLFFVGAVIATFIVVLKQRRARQREMQVPPSRASSIIPIMPPPPAPEMWSGADPFIGSPRQFSSPRRMDGRLLTPTTAPPTYPLPLPPTAAHPIGDYWTSRPVRNQFSPV
ncbi:unnamed protein product [Mycena citricolor]|uniref:Uncharacterized protein n=1 Tax=Mycena citricolor TaxID=2018698 RepID=A0AAD2GZF7_9AGAR|nr:unnamed protein product [Mycena citricolor]